MSSFSFYPKPAWFEIPDLGPMPPWKMSFLTPKEMYRKFIAFSWIICTCGSHVIHVICEYTFLFCLWDQSCWEIREDFHLGVVVKITFPKMPIPYWWMCCLWQQGTAKSDYLRFRQGKFSEGLYNAIMVICTEKSWVGKKKCDNGAETE